MASSRKIAANRSNARKSTGPRSKAGREASRRNALRHGLAVPIGTAPEFRHDIEKLAKLLSSDRQDAGDRAREAAEAELDLLRIRKIRAGLFEAFYCTTGGFAELNGLAELNNRLGKLERYERRAFSRRKRALLALQRTGSREFYSGKASGAPQHRVALSGNSACLAFYLPNSPAR
jgi:hypothetical protein